MDTYRSESGDSDELADACLGYLVANPEELARFMSQAGLDADALRKSVGSRSLASGMMDYFAHNESALLAMCANSGISAENFIRKWRQHNPDR